MQSIKQNFDIIIVGGGMIGATAALCYAQLGYSIGLIEAIPVEQTNSPSFDQRAVALSASSVAILKSLNLWSQLEKLACPIEKIHVSDQGQMGFTRLTAKDCAVDALGQVVTLESVGPCLWEAIRQQPLITTFCPANVVDVVNTTVECQVTIALSATNEMEAIEVCLSAELLLATDGTFSKMADLSGISASREVYSQHAVVANIVTQKPHEFKAFERFTPNGPLALLPLAQNQMSLVWCQSPEKAAKILAMDQASLIHLLQQEFGYRLGRIKQIGALASYPLGLHIIDKPVKNNMILLGNAAHTLHPIAGQGVNLGLRDVAGLNDLLIQSAKEYGTVKLVSQMKSVLSKYETYRQQDWQQTVSATDGLARLFSQEFYPLVLVRNKMMSTLNLLPWAKRQLANSAMGYGGRSSRLTRGFVNPVIVGKNMPTVFAESKVTKKESVS